MIEVFEREACVLHNVQRVPFVMHLYGSCFASFDDTANVVELLERFNVALKEELGWQTRVQVCRMSTIYMLFLCVNMEMICLYYGAIDRLLKT
jgi:hypothetical protein